MKNFIIFAVALGTSLFAFSNHAEAAHHNIRDLDTNNNGIYEACEVDPCESYQCGPCVCYCPVTRFRPCEYCETRTVKEPYTCQKRCCRYVKKYFDKTFCKYVPEYYTQKYCVEVPEYYCVDETKYRCRQVKDKKCKYIPYTCWEKKCCDCNDVAQPSCPCR